MNRDNTITYGILLGILVIIIIVIYFVNINEKKKNIDKQSNEFNEIAVLNDTSTFFAVENNINKLYSNYSSKEYKKIYNILNKNYLNKNNITISNIKDLDMFNNDGNLFKANEIYVVSNNGVYKYFVKGSLFKDEVNNTTDLNSKQYFALERNFSIGSFDIMPITKKEYSKYIKATSFDFNKVKSNSDNTFDYHLLGDEELCAIFLNYYINDCLYNSEKLYKNLSDGTKNPKFTDYNSFKQYIENNKIKISNEKISKYRVADNRYIIVTESGNEYRFTVTNSIDYKVTIKLFEDQEEELQE